MTKQMTMPGTDTDLSIAADEYIKACNAVEVSQAKKETSRSALVELMKSGRKHRFTHNGRTLELREGRLTKDVVVVK